MHKTYSAALYLRLSRDDGSPESESIVSQRLQLTQYAQQHHFPITAVYADDGISGSRWDRAGLQEMLHAIEDGCIDLVLVKDLSRLSRDYIRTGELLERWFPAHNTRLIAVDDHVDTALCSPTNDFSAIRAVMDDWYARDISQKVRAAIYARQKAGCCTAATLPFGYRRAADRSVVIDEARAVIVREIFARYLTGESCCAIARALTENRIPAPKSGETAWHDATVGRILRNPAYAGRLRLHVTRTHSYKYRRKQYLPEQEMCFCTVPAIIPQAQFDAVQRRLQNNGHAKPPAAWLSGKVYCGECGARMQLSRQNGRQRLLCGCRKRGGCCQNPSMDAAALVQAILRSLANHGFPNEETLLPVLIGHITAARETVEVFLRYAYPDIQKSAEI